MDCRDLPISEPTETCGGESSCGCVKTVIQYANISSEIDILPKIEIGEIETECLGGPDIKCVGSPCKKACKLILSQTVRIKIPIQYSAAACVDESSANCGCNKPACK